MLFLRNTHSLKDAERKEPINLVGIKEKESQKGVSLELAPETLGALNRLKWKKDLLGRGKSLKKKNNKWWLAWIGLDDGLDVEEEQE